jgi:hypothetical protein
MTAHPTENADMTGRSSHDDVRIYTAEQAATLLHVSPWWLRKKSTAGAIPCTFIGRYLRFTAEDLAKIIAAGAHPQGDTAINAITRMMVRTWVKELSQRRAPATVTDILALLSMLMSEAVEERRITLNPCRRLRPAAVPKAERPWATPAQVLAIASHLNQPEATLVVTAAYTGTRWGELVGLQRHNYDLKEARLHIDPEVGALYEIAGTLELGLPKTPPPSAASRYRRSWPPGCANTWTATTTTTSSPVPTAACAAARTSPAASGDPPPTGTRRS